MPRNFQEIQKYDAIIVGSGIGGLTSAGLLAKAGQSVLLLERHDRPGGYAHGFRRKKYVFDSGVHLTSGCGPGGYRGGQIIHKVFQAMGILDRVEFLRIDPISRAFFPGLQISLPVSIDNFIETLTDHFPDEENGLRRLILLCVQLSEELAIADEIMAGADFARARERLPVLFEYRRKTLSDVCDKFIVNPKLKGVFATLWPYLGLPPSKVSFLYWSTMFIGYLVDGAYYCAGGFQKFADAMAEGILRHGGKLQFRAEVSGIEITDGKVSGVRLPGGRRVEAPVVIANSDMRHTVGRLVGERYFPERYLKRMAKMSPSLSIFAVYIATDLDLKKRDIAHESFCYRDFDHDENFARTRAGEVSWISMTVPTLADPSLAPKGEHLIMLTTLLPYDVGMPWKEAKPLYMGKMLEIAEQYIPGLGGRLRYIDGGSPATMERYTQNHRGSAYGWDVTPDQVGPNRLANRSPIAGLYFAGHWSSPGGGVYGACVSGVQTAQLVLGLPKRDEFWSWLIREENNDNERKVKEIGSK